MATKVKEYQLEQEVQNKLNDNYDRIYDLDGINDSQLVREKISFTFEAQETNTGPVTVDVPGIGNMQVVDLDGIPMQGEEFIKGAIYTIYIEDSNLVYNISGSSASDTVTSQLRIENGKYMLYTGTEDLYTSEDLSRITEHNMTYICTFTELASGENRFGVQKIGTGVDGAYADVDLREVLLEIGLQSGRFYHTGDKVMYNVQLSGSQTFADYGERWWGKSQAMGGLLIGDTKQIDWSRGSRIYDNNSSTLQIKSGSAQHYLNLDSQLSRATISDMDLFLRGVATNKNVNIDGEYIKSKDNNSTSSVIISATSTSSLVVARMYEVPSNSLASTRGIALQSANNSGSILGTLFVNENGAFIQKGNGSAYKLATVSNYLDQSISLESKQSKFQVNSLDKFVKLNFETPDGYSFTKEVEIKDGKYVLDFGNEMMKYTVEGSTINIIERFPTYKFVGYTMESGGIPVEHPKEIL